jgi:hypothetical protein
MTNSQTIGRNAWFWFREYTRYVAKAQFYKKLGNEQRAAEFVKVAGEYLDWHFDLVERLATMESEEA